MDVNVLDPDVLETRLRSLLAGERRALAAFLLHLGEFDRRKQYRRHGYATLWQYCQNVLGLSETQTYFRMAAAQLIQRFPVAADFIADGRICITSLVLLRNALSESNVDEVLRSAVGKSKPEILLLAATLRPSPLPDQESIRKLPTRSETAPVLADAPAVEVSAAKEAREEPHAEPVPASQPAVQSTARFPTPPRPVVEIAPTSADQYSIRLVVDRDFVELLERARSALSHVVPDGDRRAVIARALRDLVDKVPSAPRRKSKEGDPGKRYVSAELRRQVKARDGNRCVFPTATGACGSTWQLEIDHVVAVAQGGQTVLENLRLVCRNHNQMHARLDFGDEVVDDRIRSARERAVH